MARGNAPLLAFNRGEISPLSLSRIDIDRVNMSASIMVNWMPKTVGAMIFRPGLEYINSTLNDTGIVPIEFVASTDAAYLLEMSPNKMRVLPSDSTNFLSRSPVTTTISDFNSDTGKWKNTSLYGIGDMSLGDTGLILNANATGETARARAKYELGDTGQVNKVHAITVNVDRGPIKIRVGNDTGDDSYVGETSLGAGYHNLAFTPTDTGAIHIQFLNPDYAKRIVSSIGISDTGTLEIPTPWGADNIADLRWAQSADVMFVACRDVKQYRIERRNAGLSWSVVEYRSNNGPYTGKTSQARLRANGYYGNTTLIADQPFFKEDHVGAIFELYTTRYDWEFRLVGDEAATLPITVTGIDDSYATTERDYYLTISGSFDATLNIEHSTGDKEFGPYQATNSEIGSWIIDITAPGSFEKIDSRENSTLNNVTLYSRVTVRPGSYVSGVIVVRFVNGSKFGYDGGGDYSEFRVVGYNSPTSVNVEVLVPPTTKEFTPDWREGWWSGVQNWPTDVTLFEGRLWWHGSTNSWGSVSDDYENFDDDEVGDAGPIERTLGEGPVDSIVFSVGLQRLLIGTVGGVISLRSSSYDEPLTSQNSTAKFATTQGAKSLRAAKTDSQAIYVDRSGRRAFALLYDFDNNDYRAKDLTLLNPSILEAGVVAIAIQRQPDTRIHCVLSNGEVAVLTYEPEEELLCWSRVATDGLVENVSVLPGAGEDRVYYIIKRNINGIDRRFVERWAREDEAIGNTVNKMADCFVQRSVSDGDIGATLNGLGHLVGKTVSLWRDGQDRGTFVVDTGGSIADTGSSGGDTGIIGLVYQADFKSVKLAYLAKAGTALTQPKIVNAVGLNLANAHPKSLQYGTDSGNLWDMPDHPRFMGAVDTGTIWDIFDEQSIPLGGAWNTDSRLHLRAIAPRPVTVTAAIVNMRTEDKA